MVQLYACLAHDILLAGAPSNGSAPAEGQTGLSEKELKKLTVKELKVLLKDQGLKIPKLKAEMISALLSTA